MASLVTSSVNEHVFEIRFRPNARVLDFRGDWTATLGEALDLPEWHIDTNRIDVFAKDQSARAFVAFRNAGMTLRDTGTPSLFPDKASQFIRQMFGLEGFGHTVHVERLGVRSKFGVGCSLPFAKLLQRFTERYVSPTSSVTNVMGRNAKIVDAGAPLNLTDDLGQLNTMCGPMTREQFAQFFSKDEGFPEVGLYFDVDYWLKPGEAMGAKEVEGQTRKFAAEAWAKKERLVAHLLES